jgi:ABC-type multidrug transport system ATPase subunit
MPNIALRFDTVASNDFEPAKLTSFRPLQAAAAAADDGSRAQSHNADTGKWTDVTVQCNDYQTAVDRELGAILQQAQQVSKVEQSKQPHESITLDETVDQQFSIVWTKLSFEVGLTNYDKLINTTLDGVRSLCSLGGLLSRRNEEKVADLPVGQTEASKGSPKPSIEPSDTVTSKMVDLGFDRRVVFENLNGYINSGELSAILGPSGAGKTSLLNALCGKTENYRGRIQLIGGGRQRMRLSIIPQKDYLIENLTVRENLLYSSRLLNPARDFNHEANIMRVVRMLNLTACFRSTVANISGGEYKRVSIAQELLRQPDILVLDEPTSGLDSLNCKNLIGSLVKLIQASRDGLMKPIAIVMTIHQPDVEVFHMFDHVYCMARGGRVIYDGHPRDAVRLIREQANLVADQRLANRFAGEGSSSGTSLGATLNGASLLIEVASENLYGSEPIDRLASLNLRRFEKYLSSIQQQAVVQMDPDGPAGGPLTARRTSRQADKTAGVLGSHTIDAPEPFAGQPEDAGACGLIRDRRLNVKTEHSNLFWYHTGLLAQRAFVSALRDPLMTVISFAFYLTVPFILWVVYSNNVGSTHGCPINQREFDLVSMASNQTTDRLASLQDELIVSLESSVLLFFTTYAYSLCSLSVAALAFPLDMHVLLKEVRNGWYNKSSYVLAKTIANIPFEVLLPTISFIMVYVLMDMPSSKYEWRMWAMALVMVVVSMTSTTYGLIFGALCMDSVQTSILLASASSLPQVLMSGFLARVHEMPVLLQKLSWLSLYRYSSDLSNMIRFGFNICPCDELTDEYLRTRMPAFKDVTDNIKPALIYYLMNNSPDPAAATDDGAESGGNSSSTALADTLAPQTIPGIEYGLTLNETERYALLKRMDAKEVDLFDQVADLLSRSFAFGRRIDGCAAVRPQVLDTFGTPTDDKLALMFGCMLLLLLVSKLCLFIIVHQKVSSRI